MPLIFFCPAENLELALNTCSFWYLCVTCMAQATPDRKVYTATKLGMSAVADAAWRATSDSPMRI